MPITNANTLSALTIPRAVASNLIGALSSKYNIYSPQRTGRVSDASSELFEGWSVNGCTIQVSVLS
jgi:hypothetical protein